jgi:hypothetical protein
MKGGKFAPVLAENWELRTENLFTNSVSGDDTAEESGGTPCFVRALLKWQM